MTLSACLTSAEDPTTALSASGPNESAGTIGGSYFSNDYGTFVHCKNTSHTSLSRILLVYRASAFVGSPALLLGLQRFHWVYGSAGDPTKVLSASVDPTKALARLALRYVQYVRTYVRT